MLGNFETYFEALAALFAEPPFPDPAQLAAVGERFGVVFDPASMNRLAQTHGSDLGRPG